MLLWGGFVGHTEYITECCCDTHETKSSPGIKFRMLTKQKRNEASVCVCACVCNCKFAHLLELKLQNSWGNCLNHILITLGVGSANKQKKSKKKKKRGSKLCLSSLSVKPTIFALYYIKIVSYLHRFYLYANYSIKIYQAGSCQGHK